MCAACGTTEVHLLPLTADVTADAVAGSAAEPTAGLDVSAAPPARFAALRQRDCRTYLGGGMLSMMADNIEHVITYWVLWETFHSPALAGFEVISHWVPFLLFSVYFGGLADRFDCRRVIQVAQVMFMAVSVAWGVLFLTGTLRIWDACLLLVVHGLAGALWGPAEQLMLHDFVGPAALPSAIRLNSTARSLGILLGPVIGSVLLTGLGPETGIFVNAGIYLPLTGFLLLTRFSGHSRDDDVVRVRLTLFDAFRVLGEVRGNPTMLSLIALGGLGAFFVGVALQSTMPIFAGGFGSHASDTVYGVLLFANGLGGVIGGLLLEVTNTIKPTLKVVIVFSLVFGASTAGFAVTHSYPLAILMLVIGGTANLAATSIGQTLVQLMAAPGERGRVVGLYGMAANGLRFGSGVTVGLIGGLVGVHASLAVSSLALCLGTLVVAGYARTALARTGSRTPEYDSVQRPSELT
jgi:MFS family permease